MALLKKIPSYINAGRFLLSKTPAHFIFFVTARCTLRCNHCFYWREIDAADPEKELSLKEITRISKSMPHIKLLSLTGGEPFLRADLAEVTEVFYRNNDVHHLVVHSNGILTQKIQTFSERIMKTCPGISLSISLSIDGVGIDHDTIRGGKNLFKSVLETIESLQDLRKKYRDFEVEVVTVVSHHNYSKMKQIIDFVQGDQRIDTHSVEIVRGNTRDPKAISVSSRGFREVLEYLHSLTCTKDPKADYPLSSFRSVVDELTPEIELETMEKERMILPCTAGKRVVVLTEQGELLPCEMLDASFGNVRDQNYNIPAMLFSEKGRELKNSIRESKCYCTWGCAVSNNIIFNLSAYPMIMKRWIRSFFSLRNNSKTCIHK